MSLVFKNILFEIYIAWFLLQNLKYFRVRIGVFTSIVYWKYKNYNSYYIALLFWSQTEHGQVLYVHVYLENSNEAIGEICVGGHAMSKVRSWREFLIKKKTNQFVVKLLYLTLMLRFQKRQFLDCLSLPIKSRDQFFVHYWYVCSFCFS